MRVLPRTWRVIRSLVSRSREHSGQSLVELALCTPLLLGLLLGCIEFGFVYSSHLNVIDASREGARLAARGDVYPPPELAFVVMQHSTRIDLEHHGLIVKTAVKVENGSFTQYDVAVLWGSGGSRFSQGSLYTAYQAAIAGNPSYLGKEKFVVLEVTYEHSSLTGITSLLSPMGVTDPMPLYAYTIMPVAGPS